MKRSLNLHYILDGRTPVPVANVLELAMWFEVGDNRRIASDQIGDVWVSTVFLGLDHSHGPPGSVPILFETMAFRDKEELACERYASYEEAEAGHTAMLQRVVDGTLGLSV